MTAAAKAGERYKCISGLEHRLYHRVGSLRPFVLGNLWCARFKNERKTVPYAHVCVSVCVDFNKCIF